MVKCFLLNKIKFQDRFEYNKQWKQKKVAIKYNCIDRYRQNGQSTSELMFLIFCECDSERL